MKENNDFLSFSVQSILTKPTNNNQHILLYLRMGNYLPIPASYLKNSFNFNHP